MLRKSCTQQMKLVVLKRKGFKGAVKIAGAELWLDIVNHFYKSKSFYLVGAKDEVINKTIRQLKEEFPGINILGYRNGYLQTDEERAQLIDNIAKLKPDVVFVAMSEVRIVSDELETVTSAEYWPYPSYGELLFGVR